MRYVDTVRERVARKHAAIGAAVLLLILLYVPHVPIGFWILPPTGSMQPTMTGCDVVLYGPGEPDVDDVMFYWEQKGSLIIHRIVDENEDGYVFKGDNIPEPDGTIAADRIHAEVYAMIRTPIPRDSCMVVFEPLYNGYYRLIGVDRTFDPIPPNNTGQ